MEKGIPLRFSEKRESMSKKASYSFHVPEELNASAPPERRGVRRDQVKLLVLNRETGKAEHSVFYELDQYIQPGDVVILNNSRTIPAELTGLDTKQQKVVIRLAQRINEGSWKALIVQPRLLQVGDRFRFGEHIEAVISSAAVDQPLVTLQFSICCEELWDVVYRHGQPIRYEYIHDPWELDYYQTVFATVPGSVEMPSAGRAFSWELIQKLRKKQVQIGFIQLHTGLSYYEDDQWVSIPSNHYEDYVIPESTVQLIQQAKKTGGRVIAVGTTVVRALESVYDRYQQVKAVQEQTNLYITSGFKLQVVDGLITGLHEPEASHLDLLSAFVSPQLLQSSYLEAIRAGYLWHEFGDMNLII